MVTDITEWRRGEFIVSTDRARLDVHVIHGFLTNSYWAKGISRDLVTRSLEHSLCFGIYDESGSKGPGLTKPARPGAPQVGFSRVVSDLATVAYLGDVFVQFSGFTTHWRRWRWLLFVVGTLFAAAITRFFALGLFSSQP